MNKLELIQAVKEKTGLTQQEAADVVRIVFQSMTDALANGERVEIRGLFSFYAKEYRPYIARNPKTGEKVQVSGKKLPVFKPGLELRQRVNS